ncbi:MAG: hypothetical protein ACYDAB_12345 [bacterium]
MSDARPTQRSGARSGRGYFVTLVRYVAHAVDTEDALRAAVTGAGEILDVDVEAAGVGPDSPPARLLTARDVAR